MNANNAPRVLQEVSGRIANGLPLPLAVDLEITGPHKLLVRWEDFDAWLTTTRVPSEVTTGEARYEAGGVHYRNAQVYLAGHPVKLAANQRACEVS